MKSTKNEITDKNKIDSDSKEYIYPDENIKNFEFYDYVRLRSGPRGTLFSFGKKHPEGDKFLIFKEVLIPLDVAYRLMKILNDHFKKMEEDGVINIDEKSAKGGEADNE